MTAIQTTLIWYGLEGPEASPIGFAKPSSQITLGDIKKNYNGPQCMFFVKTIDLDNPSQTNEFGESVNYAWNLLTDDNSSVLSYDDPSLLIKVRSIERQQTRVTYFVEGRDEPIRVTIPKPSSHVTLPDIKNYYPGTIDGAYLFKGWEPHGQIWAVIIDNNSTLPSINDEIQVQIKRKHAQYTTVELLVEGDDQPIYFHFNKPSYKVTMREIRSFYSGPPGIFLVKTPEVDGINNTWTIFGADAINLPCYNDTIIIKVKVFKDLQLLQSTDMLELMDDEDQMMIEDEEEEEDEDEDDDEDEDEEEEIEYEHDDEVHHQGSEVE